MEPNSLFFVFLHFFSRSFQRKGCCRSFALSSPADGNDEGSKSTILLFKTKNTDLFLRDAMGNVGLKQVSYVLLGECSIFFPPIHHSHLSFPSSSRLPSFLPSSILGELSKRYTPPYCLLRLTSPGVRRNFWAALFEFCLHFFPKTSSVWLGKEPDTDIPELVTV